LLTFGGAYSNHIYAVAAAGDLYGFETVGVIRGEKYDRLNPTLAFASTKGMHLHYLSRAEYRNKYSPECIHNLKKIYGKFYLLPEGGTNSLALKGCAEIIEEIDISFNIMVASCGTGGTLGGIIAGLEAKHYVIGFPALKNGAFLHRDIKDHIKSYSDRVYLNWRLELDYHFGGYARFTMALIDFINDFKKSNNIPLDPIYTGKMMYGIFDLVKKDTFEMGTKILAIHTGGLQGIQGFNERYGHLING
jgi:1-aminocyclopropane-1-carboxylate deaminase/D-cysteine desulfhydrase-like pyridoxal-dependent ACC family enzyme